MILFSHGFKCIGICKRRDNLHEVYVEKYKAWKRRNTVYRTLALLYGTINGNLNVQISPNRQITRDASKKYAGSHNDEDQLGKIFDIVFK